MTLTRVTFIDNNAMGNAGALACISCDWDLHLSTSSPLIDAGDPTILDPDGSTSDIGSYGGPGAAGWDLDSDGWFDWWVPGEYDVLTSPGMDCNDRDDGIHPGSGC